MLRNILLTILTTFLSVSAMPQKMSLQGEWKLFTDLKHEYGLSFDKITFDDKISLPASLDEAGKGIKSAATSNTSRFLRKYSFYGKAWYQREVTIPSGWKSKTILFSIERTRVSHVWVDGIFAGSDSLISVKQEYDLTQLLKPGKHLLTICVDNGSDCGLPKEVGSSHMWTDETQTIWNGILGEICLEAKNELTIKSVKSIPDITNNSLKLILTIDNQGKKSKTAFLEVSCKQNHPIKISNLFKKGTNTYEIVYPIGNNAIHWSEYSPTLYKLSIQLKTHKIVYDSCSASVGLRRFTADGKFFSINGKHTFLRGKHDACVFPLTGYAPMEKEAWVKYFDTLRSYGFNHVRFHSWCPPEAAFEVADEKGFYLQPELPFWGEIDSSLNSSLNRFLLREGKAMLDKYANHPSFVMFSNGNELWGEVKSMRQLTDQFRQYDDRPLYTFGTNYHLGWLGGNQGEDYLISCRVGGKNDDIFESHVRTSFSFADAKDGGILNAMYPNTLKTLETGVEMTNLPVVSHETGQFEMYPDPNEIKQYTGVLSPQNLSILIQRVESKSGAKEYKKYFDASAALSLLCYKADLEMMRRTDKLAGFEMLDLQDYPGQGTAVVGILNSLMQSKGIISETEFRQWNNDVMPLWEANAYCWSDDTIFSGKIAISNNSPNESTNQKIKWTLICEDGKVLSQDIITTNIPASKLSTIGQIKFRLPKVGTALRANLVIELEGTSIKNSWPVWIYPHLESLRSKDKSPDGYKIFNKYDTQLLTFLKTGGKAILMPTEDSYPLQTVGGLFTTDFWNFSMFKTISENTKKPISPGTMGLLIDNLHPIFHSFPTETHSNWQWWPIVRNSNPLILDNYRSTIHPIAETIDNVERAHYLGLIFECKVGKGKLLVCMTDLQHNLQYIENRQLFNTLTDYAGSEQFQPKDELTPEQLNAIFETKVSEEKIDGVKNVSYK